ncbi:MAG TPA: NFACT RNA binding domain-containing protein, partial [Magnetospirillaceae bacterium]|nr:NFACT RNA binding domain-containing protein [Magnetospirillaceae bacterium]
MSLNHREIDLVLSELDIVGAQVQRVYQPAYDTLVLSLYKPGASTELFFCLAHGACRLHAAALPVPKSPKPLRFAELLWSRLRNGRVESVRQLGAERIVRLDIRAWDRQAGSQKERDPELQETDPDVVGHIRYRLYARLWSGAANLILTDDSGRIVDALARRPKRGEVSGGTYRPEEDLPAAAPNTGFEVRELPGSGSFNERLERIYAPGRGELSKDRLLVKVREWYARKKVALEARAAELDLTAAEYADAGRLRELGDILMGSIGTVPDGGYIEAEDFHRGGTARIRIDTDLDIVGNARAYYERYRKAGAGLADAQAEAGEVRRRLGSLDAELTALEAEESLYKLRAFVARRSSAEGVRKSYPGIRLEKDGWTILIGRSARENDELLRLCVRGNDLWLYARDWPGAYVFIKNRPGKSVPLEILLDAGSLALHYSKGRSAGRG